MAVLAGLAWAAPSAHASLSLPTGGPAVSFSGAGPGTVTALASFEAAAGGVDNGTNPGEQGSGFRRVSWDDIRLDGSDPGSAVIESGRVVAPAPSRLQPWGLNLGPNIAVSGDGFHSVNAHVQFTPYSAPNVWAPFNSHTAELQIIAPGSQASTPVPAQTRGLGVVFLNVHTATTLVQYYNGDILLGQAPAQTGAASFVGMLFPAAVVNRVVITLGTAEVFSLDGSAAGIDPNTMVAGDDIALAEPAPARPAVSAMAGVPVTAILDAFTETSPGATVTAAIDWGDGVRTAGAIEPGAGGWLVVTGNHAYARTGSYTAKVTVEDFQGPQQTSQTDIEVGPRATTTGVRCAPSPVAVTAATTCTATVSDAASGSQSAPTGLVSFTSPTLGVAFAEAGACRLGPSPALGVSMCEVQFTAGRRPPNQAHVFAGYDGDSAHAGSSGTATIGIRLERCRLRALSRRLRPAGLGLLATCDARANLRITVKALVTRTASFMAFQLQFGTLRTSVSAGRPTVLIIKPAPGVLPALRAALHRHQSVSLRLTMIASSHATRRTTTTRIAAIRIS